MKKETSFLFKGFPILLLLFLGLTFSSCKKDSSKPEDSFIKIYNDTEGSRNYFPLSLKATNDGGYLILSAYNGANIHLVKTNKTGEMLWEYDLPSQYVNAVPGWIERNGTMYFVCMDAVGLFTYIMQVDENAKNASISQEFQEIKYPLYVLDNASEVYIQNYERTSLRTGIYELSANMDQIQNDNSVQIFTDVEDKVIHHLNFTGKRFPFFVQMTPEKDYLVFNGFNNYSFSIVFLKPNLDFAGVYNGAAFDGGMNALLPLGGNQFSLARFSFSNLYFHTNTALDPTAIDIVESIPAQGQAELDAASPVLIKKINISSTNYVAYLASTKSNQLLLKLYASGSTTLSGSKYLGQSTPLIACDLTETPDGGLMILMRVTVMGSFNRIATLKLSKAELEGLVD